MHKRLFLFMLCFCRFVTCAETDPFSVIPFEEYMPASAALLALSVHTMEHDASITYNIGYALLSQAAQTKKYCTCMHSSTAHPLPFPEYQVAAFIPAEFKTKEERRLYFEGMAKAAPESTIVETYTLHMPEESGDTSFIDIHAQRSAAHSICDTKITHNPDEKSCALRVTTTSSSRSFTFSSRYKHEPDTSLKTYYSAKTKGKAVSLAPSPYEGQDMLMIARAIPGAISSGAGIHAWTGIASPTSSARCTYEVEVRVYPKTSP